MITKIGIIYQDRNSLGFLEGLRARLKCEAKFVEYPTAIGKTRRLPRRQAKLAWLYFQKQNVDLVVRFTDADRHRWQDVRRKELEVFPDEARPLCVCGVAVNNVEEWLGLDVDYLTEVLHVQPGDVEDPQHRTGCIKRAIISLRGDKGLSDVVAGLVRGAPRSVFRQWLVDGALRRFYSDCRAAATSAECETPNELEEGA